MPAANTISLENVSKTFGAVAAVDSLSASIPQGCIYGFLGPNGAGKTTTLRMILSIIYPDAGTIRIFDEPASASSLARIGYLPEERGLYRKMRVVDVLAYFGRLKGMTRDAIRDRIPKCLELVHLNDAANRRVEELSKGNQQKLQLVSTILHEPDFLILDEPFSGLDPINMELISNLMLQMRDEGKTIIFSTHVMDQAQRLCDSILLINRGRKIIDGPVDELLSNFRANDVILEVDGDTSFIDELPFVRSVTTKRRRLEVALQDGTDSRQLLEALMGRVTIRTFEEKLPSLHDIFIRLVGESTEPIMTVTG
ncbi:MAG: ABC transporter ATP-binding protein [Candidatus Sumerlaeaceae bacterium]